MPLREQAFTSWAGLRGAVPIVLGKLFVPRPETTMRTGDHLLLAATADHQQAVEHRLRAISRAGRLATWHGERGLVSA